MSAQRRSGPEVASSASGTTSARATRKPSRTSWRKVTSAGTTARTAARTDGGVGARVPQGGEEHVARGAAAGVDPQRRHDGTACPVPAVTAPAGGRPAVVAAGPGLEVLLLGLGLGLLLAPGGAGAGPGHPRGVDAGAVPVVDVDDDHPRRARVEHRQQRRQPAGAGAVAHGGRHADERHAHEAGHDAGQRTLHARHHHEAVRLGEAVAHGEQAVDAGDADVVDALDGRPVDPRGDLRLRRDRPVRRARRHDLHQAARLRQRPQHRGAGERVDDGLRQLGGQQRDGLGRQAGRQDRGVRVRGVQRREDVDDLLRRLPGPEDHLGVARAGPAVDVDTAVAEVDGAVLGGCGGVHAPSVGRGAGRRCAAYRHPVGRRGWVGGLCPGVLVASRHVHHRDPPRRPARAVGAGAGAGVGLLRSSVAVSSVLVPGCGRWYPCIAPVRADGSAPGSPPASRHAPAVTDFAGSLAALSGAVAGVAAEVTWQRSDTEVLDGIRRVSAAPQPARGSPPRPGPRARRAQPRHRLPRGDDARGLPPCGLPGRCRPGATRRRGGPGHAPGQPLAPLADELAAGRRTRAHVDVAVRVLDRLPAGVLARPGASADIVGYLRTAADDASPLDMERAARQLLARLDPDAGSDRFDPDGHTRRFLDVAHRRDGHGRGVVPARRRVGRHLPCRRRRRLRARARRRRVARPAAAAAASRRRAGQGGRDRARGGRPAAGRATARRRAPVARAAGRAAAPGWGVWSAATRCPRGSPDAWPATRCCSAWSRPRRSARSTSGGSTASSRSRSDGRSPPATAAASSPAAVRRPTGATPTTSSTGSTAVAPTSSNYVLLCPGHHTAVHAGTWGVALQAGQVVVTPPRWVDPTRTPRPARHQHVERVLRELDGTDGPTGRT